MWKYAYYLAGQSRMRVHETVGVGLVGHVALSLLPSMFRLEGVRALGSFPYAMRRLPGGVLVGGVRHWRGVLL